MKEDLQKLKKEFEDAIASLKDSEELEVIRVEFLGRKGQLGSLMKELKSASAEARKELGQLANEVKQFMESAFSEKEERFEKEGRAQKIQNEWLDVTQPGNYQEEGHLHLVTQAISDITDVFSRIGFNRVSAPEIDWDFYAFESLNMPKDHPARDDWETFFVDTPEGKKGKTVLVPHTSNSQVRELEKGQLPIRMININRCYRRQSDISHVPMFHQFEGFMVDKDISISHLKGVLDYFAREFFGPNRKTRLRPHHFRFTEPSFEVDISCDVCGGDTSKASAFCRLCKGGWLELGGAGMTHPNVLRAGGIDPNEYTAFAFGWGVERTLMMRGGMKINDIRILFKNDLRFLKQF